MFDTVGGAVGTIQQRLAGMKRAFYGVILLLIAGANLANVWFVDGLLAPDVRYAVAAGCVAGALLAWFSPRSTRVIELGGLALGGVVALVLLVLALNGSTAGHVQAIRTYGNWLALLFVWAYLALGSRTAAAVCLIMLLGGTGTTWAHMSAAGAPPHTPGEHSAILDLAFIGISSLLFLYLLSYSLERRSTALAAQETTAKLSTLDPLTGLANRAAFQRVHETYFRDQPARPVSLFLVDVNDFRNINERFGTSGGDEVLREAALRLTNGLGHEARIVARVGGDEFGILLEGQLDDVQAAATAAMLERLFRAPFIAAGIPLQVTATVGVSRYPEDAQAFTEQVSQAEKAVANAKRVGETYRLAEADAREAERLALAGDLKEAIAGGELELHFQPVGLVRDLTQAELAEGNAVGLEVRSAEALLRWRHPRLGLVPPMEFIPLAERSGLIVPLGEWVLMEACRQARAWQDEMPGGMTVAVNISPHQFRHPGLVAAIERALTRSQLDPAHLIVEITETSADQPVVAERLSRIRRLGVRVALDDFGAGYSSLGRLRNLPIDFVKLDRSFIATLDRGDERSLLVVRAAVQLAHGLGAQVVAEGIERPEQALAAAEAGCDFLQGFLISRPMPAGEYETTWHWGAQLAWPVVHSGKASSALTGL